MHFEPASCPVCGRLLAEIHITALAIQFWILLGGYHEEKEAETKGRIAKIV